MTPTFTIHHGDCLDVLRTMEAGSVDAIVTDPPYGIGEANGKNINRGGPVGFAGGRGKFVASKDYGRSAWDDAPCSPEAMAEMHRVSNTQIIFGGNYFELPPSSCWLVWDKVNGNNDFADCELAWTNMDRAVRIKRFMWNGMLRDEKCDRVHPTQKPVGVMRWCLSFLPEGCTVLDPFMGSGTTGVACMETGRNFIGIEIDARYCEIARKRIKSAQDQGRLFSATKDETQ